MLFHFVSVEGNGEVFAEDVARAERLVGRLSPGAGDEELGNESAVASAGPSWHKVQTRAERLCHGCRPSAMRARAAGSLIPVTAPSCANDSPALDLGQPGGRRRGPSLRGARPVRLRPARASPRPGRKVNTQA